MSNNCFNLKVTTFTNCQNHFDEYCSLYNNNSQYANMISFQHREK